MTVEEDLAVRIKASRTRITVLQVQKATARHYNMTEQELLTRTRRHSVARPRQVAMYIATKLTAASLPDIGQRFGGFDHTTVMYARNRIEKLKEEDIVLSADVFRIMRNLVPAD